MIYNNQIYNVSNIHNNLNDSDNSIDHINSNDDHHHSYFNFLAGKDPLLNFDLSITDNQNSNKKLKIFSNLDFVLLDKYSITQREKVITYNVNKLIK